MPNQTNHPDAIQRILSLTTLEENWDGYDASKPCERCISNALEIVRSLPPDTMSPEVSPNPNGTVTLDWETDVTLLSVEVGATRMSAFFVSGDRMAFYQGRHTTETPQFLKNALAVFKEAATASPAQCAPGAP